MCLTHHHSEQGQQRATPARVIPQAEASDLSAATFVQKRLPSQEQRPSPGYGRPPVRADTHEDSNTEAEKKAAAPAPVEVKKPEVPASVSFPAINRDRKDALKIILDRAINSEKHHMPSTVRIEHTNKLLKEIYRALHDGMAELPPQMLEGANKGRLIKNMQEYLWQELDRNPANYPTCLKRS